MIIIPPSNNQDYCWREGIMRPVDRLPVEQLGFLKKSCLGINQGRVTHICVNKLTGIGSDNGLSPGRRQAIIWTNAGILLTGPLGIFFDEMLIQIQTF